MMHFMRDSNAKDMLHNHWAFITREGGGESQEC